MTLRIGTRGSALALTQTGLVADALASLSGLPRDEVELVTVRTDGDRLPGSLASLGGTGVFATALRDALRAGRCDLAVHSMKDLPTAPPDGLRLVAVPERVDPRDALCARDGLTLATLPAGARVGTGSPRRAAQLRAVRPDLDVVDLRGNVPTRLGRVAGHQRPDHDDPGDLDAVVLAMAGLTRLGLLAAVTEPLDPAVVMPAPAQGALAVEAAGPLDEAAEAGLAALDHVPTRLAVLAERSLLAALEAGCAAPVGALGRVEDGVLVLDATVSALDGSRRLTATDAAAVTPDPAGAKSGVEARTEARVETGAEASAAAAVALGQRVARALLDQGAADLVHEARADAAALATPAPAAPAHPTPDAGALAGWTVLVPRGGPWGERVAARLATHGGTALTVPLIEFAPPEDPSPLAAGLRRLAAGGYDWLVVTSATTVTALTDHSTGHSAEPSFAEAVGHARVAAVGRSTATALEGAGVTPALVPAQHSTAGLLEALPAGPARALVPHSDLADPALVDGLRARGWEVDAPVAYRTVAGPPASARVRESLATGGVQAVLLSSPSTVTQLLALVGTPPPGTVVACIGSTTRAAAGRAGLTVHVVPSSSSVDALVDALASHASHASHAQETR